jgi:hypothetical protein
MYEIESNIPMPTIDKGGRKYPFIGMKVGDSFKVGLDDFKKIRSAAYNFGTRNGMKFSIRKVNDGFRCWRVA